MDNYLIVFLVVVVFHGTVTGSDGGQMPGCYDVIDKLDHNAVIQNTSHLAVADIGACAQHCFNKSMDYFGLNYADDNLNCQCLGDMGNLQMQNDSYCSDSESLHSCLPLGKVECWRVFLTRGHYLSDLDLQLDGRVVLKDSSLFLEVVAMVTSFEDDADLDLTSAMPGEITATWTFGDNTSHEAEVVVDDLGQIYHRVEHCYTKTGRYNIDVILKNEASSVRARVSVEVIFPTPGNLQLLISDDQYDIPSCVPELYDLEERPGPLVAVFVNTSLQFKASVSMGTNLTFVFWFEDTQESNEKGPCLNQHYATSALYNDIDVIGNGTADKCLEASEDHVFYTTGIHSVGAMVTNIYGTLVENITVVALERTLNAIELRIHPESKSIVSMETEIRFLVVMEMTSRNNTYIKVYYGDGTVDVVSAVDTNSSAMILQGDGQDMEIVESYGDGCQLSLEFQHSYQREGVYRPTVTVFRNDSFAVSKTSSLTSELMADSVMLVQKLMGLRLYSKKIASCYEPLDFSLEFVSRYNLTVVWTIQTLDDAEEPAIVANFTMSETHLLYKFVLSGIYLVKATASNAVSMASVSSSIVVQCPIYNLQANCSPKYISTSEEVTCTAAVQSGSDVTFIWYFEGPISFTVQYNGNTSCLVTRRFPQAGYYDITVQAVNNVSMGEVYQFDYPITVQNPIDQSQVKFFKNSRTLLGNITKFAAMYSPPSLNIEFDFDFGFGRLTGPEPFCDHAQEMCYVEDQHLFLEAGIHDVRVYAYNHVSEFVENMKIWIIPGLENITVQIIGVPVAEILTIFVLQENGVVMETENIYFEWRFDDGQVSLTNAPVFEKMFTTTGDHNVTLRASNPVTSREINLVVEVKDRSKVNLLLKHDLVVAPMTEVLFHLRGQLEAGSKMFVTYSDDTEDMFEGSRSRWIHLFHEPGVYQINITLMAADGDLTEAMTSYLVVEQPITGVDLSGPVAVPFGKHSSELSSWVLSMLTGTHCLYRWTLEGEIITTLPEFEMEVSQPGLYSVSVTVFNDITDPITATLPIIVEEPIVDVNLIIRGNLVGEETQIIVQTLSFTSFFVNVDFGDGSHQEISSHNPIVEEEYIDNDLFVYHLVHVYAEPGEYQVWVNVSNNVSNVSRMETFIPIRNIALTTTSEQVLQTPAKVVVTAHVDCDDDLQFVWDFSDNFEETIVKSFPNHTSVASHLYGMSGEYFVSFNVTGRHYPPPGVSVQLPFSFDVVDPIETVRIDVKPTAAAISDGSTGEIIFTAISSGSHVYFIIDFGDGETAQVVGTQMYFIVVEVTMRGEVYHSYSAVGAYKVKVTAVNPLGNMTTSLSRLFYVEEPPQGLSYHLVDVLANPTTRTYAIKFGDVINFKASVTGGTNVTFNWKLGDQTDLVKSGPAVSHQYRSVGEKRIYLTAWNLVHQLSANITVQVNHEIQGVHVEPDKELITAGDSVIFRAVVRPKDTSRWYNWVINPAFHISRGQQTDRWTDTPVLLHKFITSGSYTVRVKAGNAISRVTSPPLRIHVLAKIEELDIIVIGDPLTTQPVKLRHYYYSGSDLNFTWSFGDGSHDLVTTKKIISYNYTRSEEYIVRLTARNAVSEQTVVKKLFVLEEPFCREPQVKILYLQGSKVYHSRSLSIEAHIKLECNISSAVTYHWTILDSSGTDLITSTDRLMVLPPRTLQYGKYKARLKVQISDTIVYGQNEAEFEVIPSPLIALVKGGLFRQVSQSDALLVDGSASHDPDYNLHTQLRYEWKCTYQAEEGYHGDACFRGDNKSSIYMDTAQLNIPINSLVEASNFTFELTVLADGRENSSSFQVIEIIRDRSVYSLKITCLQCSYGPINPNRKLSFSVDCENCPSSGADFKWTLLSVAGSDPYNPVRAHDNMECVLPDGTSYTAYVLKAEENEKESQRQEEELELEEERDMQERTDTSRQKVLEKEALGWQKEDSPAETVEPLLPPWDIPISEGSTGEGLNRKRRDGPRFPRQAFLPLNDTQTEFSIPMLQEGVVGGRSNWGRNPPQYPNVGENTNGGGVLPHSGGLPILISEGSPGDIGSSSGRGFSIDEGISGSRVLGTDFSSDNKDGSGQSKHDRLTKLEAEGMRGPKGKLTILDVATYSAGLRQENTLTGLLGPSLVIRPGVLKQGMVYIVLVQLLGQDKRVEGEARTSFTVNESPVYGDCTVNAETGVELETEFTVNCAHWKDEHEPLMYEISYKLDESGFKHLIYRGLDQQSTFKLPAGKPETDYRVLLYIDILDGLLAKTSVCSLPIRVLPRSSRRFSNLEPLPSRKDDVVVVVNGSAAEHQLSDSQLIHHETVGEDGTLQRAMALGDHSKSRVSISCLASWLNRVNTLNSTSEDHRIHTETRTQLLKTLSSLPVRDEGELLQTVQALSVTMSNTDELNQQAIDHAITTLETIQDGLGTIYDETLPPEDGFLPLALGVMSSIFTAASRMGTNFDVQSVYAKVHRQIVGEAADILETLLMSELKSHVIHEEPVVTKTDFFSVHAQIHEINEATMSVKINDTTFILPPHLNAMIRESLSSAGNSTGSQLTTSTNEKCFQSHMTSFQENPFSFGSDSKVQSTVSSLSLFTCQGQQIVVRNLSADNLVQVELPNRPPQVKTITEHQTLKKWVMNIHQFNVSLENFKHALHLVVELVPVKQGRLFPITVLMSHQHPPTPEYYLYKHEYEATSNTLDIFIPAASLNVSGIYHIGIVDSTFNSGRHRQGEVTSRVYQLKLWWGECLYWDTDKEAWLPDGCNISQNSTFQVTRCSCNHLTTFGSHFDLVPNKLVLVDVESFFSLNKNPVILTLVGVILFLYVILFIVCRQADLHDAKKAGIVNLLDNTLIDQQKYEITIVTGFRKGAGTSAKISLILHGEEGMSETREMISEDYRPLFERNSHDRFILTLPDSIGKIWKVQLWHNNFGTSPSWYLSRVIVRDLNTGLVYYFMCERWLAVEEEDGKVEREFTAFDGALAFTTVFWSKGTELIIDLHTWISVLTRPSFSSFQRTERLTCCLTALLLYMCFNAAWYKQDEPEYRGEFGLLDVSWRNLVVGAICCGVVIPVTLFLEFLFRRSKPENCSKCPSSDETEQPDEFYSSGKPNQPESSEDSSEHVPPIMTYSLLDQSILNWPNIQHWAQRQWLKRQQSVGSGSGSGSGSSDTHSSSTSVGSSPRAGFKPLLGHHAREALLTAEMDQASSGFEDSNSLIRPQASAGSTRTTAAPSVAESMRTHKPASLGDSVGVLKPPSISDSVKTNIAPSVSSSCSQKSSVFMDRRELSLIERIYLPFWCRYLAWILCGLICVAAATITIMYGYRFGISKSTMWLQSLYFSFMICLFIANPIMILVAVILTALRYRNDPSVFDHYDMFNREKVKEDMKKWRRANEITEDSDILERGVAARQRSRYLRFARPPQEKQLIEARKKILKEKRAVSVVRSSVGVLSVVLLLLLMAYGKDASGHYHQNSAVKNILTRTGSVKFEALKGRGDWFTWAQTSLLNAIQPVSSGRLKDYRIGDSNHIIGQVIIQQYRVKEEPCPVSLPYMRMKCRYDYDVSGTPRKYHHGNNTTGTDTQTDYVMASATGWGDEVILSKSRPEALATLKQREQTSWLDLKTGAVKVELTLYNAPTNLFTAVNLILEFPPAGGAKPVAKVMSTHLFRYVTGWDHIILACELMFFALMLYKIKQTTCSLIEYRMKFVQNLWNFLEILFCGLALVYTGMYVYRFVIISDTVEAFRSTYYEQFVDVSQVAFWDEMLRCGVGVLLFLSLLKCLQLMKYNRLCAVFGRVYQKAQRDLLVFLLMFLGLIAAYTSLGHALFVSVSSTFSDIWSSLGGVLALMVSKNMLEGRHDDLAANIYVSSFCVFATSFLTAYVIAVLSRQLRTRKKHRLLAFSRREALLFYWEQIKHLIGFKQMVANQEPDVILPPEFTMAEIEYQVEELLFRMNALTGSHGLPEKPPCYLTDSDCTYGAGDDGISSGGSEGQQYGEDRLEQRVQKIEDNLTSQEPFLAQLLKLDSIGGDDLSQVKEKQLRSHLELEIFRQLQLQRQVVLDPQEEQGKGGNSDESKEKELTELPTSKDAGGVIRNETDPHDLLTIAFGQSNLSSPSNGQAARSLQPSTTGLTIQTLQNLIAKSTNEMKSGQFELPTEDTLADKQMHKQFDSEYQLVDGKLTKMAASSSPADRPQLDVEWLVKAVEMKTRRNNPDFRASKAKSSNSSSLEKMQSESSKAPGRDAGGHGSSDSVEMMRRVLKKPEPPVKPTFLQANLRGSSLTDSCKGSPVLKLRPGFSLIDRGSKSDNSGSMTPDTSSGSEQDGINCGRKLIAKRNLRKTKSRGKGKGLDSLAPAQLLDELDVEECDDQVLS